MPVFSSNLGSLQTYSTERKVETVANYIRKMQEELEYRLAHLDSSNVTELDTDETTITGGLIQLIAEGEEGIAQLRISDQEIRLMVENTTNGLSSQIVQTAEMLQGQITDNEGNISSLTQTVNGLASTVADADGNASKALQTAESITLKVSNSDTSSTIQLYRDGVAVASQNISFTGLVSFSDLATSGKTTINGANITTGTISANRLDLSGVATITGLQNGTTTINGGCITTGTISSNRLDLSGVATIAGLSGGTTTINGGCIKTGTISAERLDLSGVATITGLKNGTTTIDGGCITSGTIEGRTIKGGTVSGTTISGSEFIATAMTSGASEGAIEMHFIDDSLNKGFDYLAGGIKLEYSGTASTDSTPRRMVIYTQDTAEGEFALKLISAGNASIEADGTVYIGGGTLTIVADNIEMYGTVKVNGTTIG